jgi:hypothetical protein
VELVKVVRRDGEDFDCATWLHKAREMPKEGFKSEVERHLTGKETEPWKITSGVTVSARFANVETAYLCAFLLQALQEPAVCRRESH